jgi:cytochrome c-type biogenesis protein CcmF
VQDDVKMAPGDKSILSGYTIKFISEKVLAGPNYHGARAHFKVINGNREADVYPEKRIYDVTNMAMTDSAIDVTAFRDIYIALGEPLDDSSWSVRLYFKPFVRWIWAGGFMILAGGLLAMSDRRYKKMRNKSLADIKEVSA